MRCAKANGLDPYDYQRMLFEKLPAGDPEDPEAIEALLPWPSGGGDGANRFRSPYRFRGGLVRCPPDNCSRNPADCPGTSVSFLGA